VMTHATAIESSVAITAVIGGCTRSGSISVVP
jgi:hypothetical protein